VSSFVIKFNRRTGESDVTEFPGEDRQEEAMRLRFRIEAEGADGDIEVVSLMSDSIETVRQTHSRYFRTLEPA
jgi:hypothetical protein